MKARWLVALLLGFSVLWAFAAPSFADDEGGDSIIACVLTNVTTLDATLKCF